MGIKFITETKRGQEPGYPELSPLPVMRQSEPRYEKTGFLHMRKQRRRSAAQ